jgi:AcrR family transcriptional regulator
MAGIGKEAGVGMGTLYVYFDSKEALINTLYKELKQANTDRIYSRVQPALPFEQNLRLLYADYLANRMEFFEEHFFIDQCANLPFLDAAARKLDEQAYVGIFELLEQGKANQEVKPLDNVLLTAHMMGAANEVVNLLRAKGEPLTSAIVEQVFWLGWSGVKN